MTLLNIRTEYQLDLLVFNEICLVMIIIESRNE
jgi:hypothetical protein